jgi:hypothetical protein
MMRKYDLLLFIIYCDVLKAILNVVDVPCCSLRLIVAYLLFNTINYVIYSLFTLTAVVHRPQQQSPHSLASPISSHHHIYRSLNEDVFTLNTV